ncbi:serine hydrolase domain-containing protein [Streptomyces sp. NPDC060232]|uniref:serine hydrolase domain-containing protein n=1 Tax=Streptomyces sp. NPDC060232 TaxID=3347079 RepID=UPI00366130D4
MQRTHRPPFAFSSIFIATHAGRPFETLLRERVLDPLGMKDTAFHVPAGKIDRLPPSRSALARGAVHVSFGQGQQGGWGFGMAVRTYRGDYAPIGQFGWDGGTGTSAYADPENGITGILLTQVGLTTAAPAQLIHDFWTTVYQAVDA